MADTPEHIKLVDDACKQYLGTTLTVQFGMENFTLGEASALAGDFYDTPEALDDLREAYYCRKFLDGALFKRVLAQQDPLRIKQCLGLGGPSFLNLAIKNHSHFRLGANGGARAACDKWHDEAVSFLPRTWQNNRVLQRESFALHFLVDLFSAGHLRTPRNAIEEHLKKIGYSDNNATKVGALLSLYQHNVDNQTGVVCEYETPSLNAALLEFNSTPRQTLFNPITPKTNASDAGSTYESVIRTLYGDDFMTLGGSSSREKTADDALVTQHMLAVIFCHLLDVCPDLALRGVRFDPLCMPYSEFMDRFLPRPIHENRGIMRVETPGSISWYGDREALVQEWIRIHVFVGDDGRTVDSVHVKLDSGVAGPVIVAGLATQPVTAPLALRVEHDLEEFDGNDTQLDQVYGDLGVAGKTIQRTTRKVLDEDRTNSR